jgi:hypothetical protein
MQLDPVDSSIVAAAGYDADLRILVILFNSGKAYQYFEVPPEVYQGFLAASSKGHFMLENVIDNYPYAIFKGWKNIQRQHTSKAE